MYKGVGFALLVLSHFSKLSHENEIIWVSLRPNYLIFIGYFKTGAGRGVQANPLSPSGSATAYLDALDLRFMHNIHTLRRTYSVIMPPVTPSTVAKDLQKIDKKIYILNTT